MGGLIILTSPTEVKYPVLDIILLIIVSIIVKYTFQSIGGFIRWIVFRKKSLKEYVNDHWEGNLAVFLLTTYRFGGCCYYTRHNLNPRLP